MSTGSLGEDLEERDLRKGLATTFSRTNARTLFGKALDGLGLGSSGALEIANDMR